MGIVNIPANPSAPGHLCIQLHLDTTDVQSITSLLRQAATLSFREPAVEITRKAKISTSLTIPRSFPTTPFAAVTAWSKLPETVLRLTKLITYRMSKSYLHERQLLGLLLERKMSVEVSLQVLVMHPK